MVKSHEDLEAYFNRLDRRFEQHEDGTYLVALAADLPPVAARLAPPVLVMQVKIGEAPQDVAPTEAKLFRKLLEFNSSDLLHAAYGLEGMNIVLSAALELDNLDLNELEAVLADMGMALAEHVPALHQMVQKDA